MSGQINNTCQAAIYHLYNIRRISRYLSYDDRKSIVQAVIMSRIDYCNSLLVGVLADQLSKLQRLQNAAARLVSNVAEYDHVTPTLVNLHRLPVTYRVNFKIAMLAHKCIYSNAPEYLKGLITVKSTTRLNFRSDEEMQDQKRHLETADKPSNRSADDSRGIRDSLYLSMQHGCNFYFFMLVLLDIS